MALPFGIDFRDTATYVTDPANYTYCLFEAYPVTRGGYTFGYEYIYNTISGRDRSTSVDPRLSGVNFYNTASSKTEAVLDIDITGSIVLDIAFGDPSYATSGGTLHIYDGSTLLQTITVPALSAGQVCDLAGNKYTDAAWPTASRSTVSVTISTQLRLGISSTTNNNPCLQSLYITSGGGGTTIVLGQAAWGVNGRAPTMQAQIALAQKAVNWNGQGATVQSQFTLGAASWGWAGRAPTVAYVIALARKAWGWAAEAPALSFFLVLGQKVWAWVGKPPIFSGSTVIALAQATWAWAARGISPLTSGAVYSAVVPAIRSAVRSAVRSALSRR